MLSSFRQVIIVHFFRFSGAIIATGPSGSGKSFSLFGELGEFARMGIVPRLGSDILDHISGDESKMHMTLSFYETGSGGAGRVSNKFLFMV